MNYKDLSQIYLEESLTSVLYDDDEGLCEVEQWESIFNNFLSQIKCPNPRIDGIKAIVNFLKQYPKKEFYQQIILSEIPILLCSYVVFFVKTNIESKANITRRDKIKIAKHSDLVRSLYLINESFKAHDLLNYDLITQEHINAFFTIYEFSGVESSNLSISIITRFAEHSKENFIKLNKYMNFKNRVMEMISNQLSTKSQIYSIYALFPFLKIDNTNEENEDNENNENNIYNEDIIELLLFVQSKDKDYKTSLAIHQFLQIYMKTSEKHMEIAVKYHALEFLICGLTVSSIDDKNFLSDLREISVDLIIFCFKARYEYRFILIKNYGLLKEINRLIISKNTENLNASLKLLNFLITQCSQNLVEPEILNTEELVQDSIHRNLVPNLYECLKGSCFDIKSSIYEIFCKFLKSGNEQIISLVCIGDGLDEIIDSIENMNEQRKLSIIESLYYTFLNYEQSWDFFDKDEAESTFINIFNNDKNKKIIELSQMMITLFKSK